MIEDKSSMMMVIEKMCEEALESLENILKLNVKHRILLNSKNVSKFPLETFNEHIKAYVRKK